MTNDSGASPHQRRTPHRLTDPGQLAEQLTRRWEDPAVAIYTLAVRKVAEDRLGLVDTWRRAALQIADGMARTQDERTARQTRSESNLRRIRKKLSWGFTVRSRGPRWSQVELLVRHLEPAEEQQATLTRLAELYRAARGRYPKGFRPATEAAEPAGAAGESSPVERLEREAAELRSQLDATQAENQRLRADLAHLAGWWSTEPPDTPHGDRSAPADAAAGGSLPSGAVDGGGCPPPPRTGRNEGRFGHPAGSDDGPVPRRPDWVDLVGTAGVTCSVEGFRHRSGGLAGPVDRRSVPGATARSPQPGTGRPTAPNTLWRRPPA